MSNSLLLIVFKTSFNTISTYFGLPKSPESLNLMIWRTFRLIYRLLKVNNTLENHEFKEKVLTYNAKATFSSFFMISYFGLNFLSTHLNLPFLTIPNGMSLRNTKFLDRFFGWTFDMKNFLKEGGILTVIFGDFSVRYGHIANDCFCHSYGIIC